MASVPVVQTSGGRLSGRYFKDGSVGFLGIPYAAPPVGSLRLRAPQSVIPWEGTRECTKVGRESVQPNQGAMGGIMPPRKAEVDPLTKLPDFMSEDCLALNVFAPALPDGLPNNHLGRTLLPVMVWIHGGAFTSGAGHNPMYRANGFVERGVVYVSINYRLGVLGFFYNPNDKEGVANVGLLDQIAALKWVQQEIMKFGGDPANVTVFGESAGAMSIGCLLGSPLSTGLFRRAILQSGACHQIMHPSQAQESARLLAQELKLDGELTAERIRSIPVATILSAQESLANKLLTAPGLAKYLKAGLIFQPVVTGPVFPSLAPLDFIRTASPTVDVLMGTTEEEFRLFMFANNKKEYNNEGLKRWLGHTLEGDPLWADGMANTIVDRLAASRSPEETYTRIQSDLLFDMPMWRLADVLAQYSPAFVYRFSWKSPIKKLRACHALELPFVFGSLTVPGINMFAGAGPEATKLSELMQNVWTQFAKSGNPGWEHYLPLSRCVMVFGEGNKATMALQTNDRVSDIEAWSSARCRPRTVAKL